MPPKPQKALSFSYYLIIAFIEGGAVMVCELMSARMIAPFYGTTLFVWSSVIGVTLGALAIGYSVGGYLIDRRADNKLLFIVLAIGAVLITLMPAIAKAAMTATAGLGVRSG